MILMSVVIAVRVNDRRIHLRNDPLDDANRRVGVADAGVLEVFEKQPCPDELRGHQGFILAVLRFASASASREGEDRHRVPRGTMCRQQPSHADFDIVRILTAGGPQDMTHLFATYAFSVGIQSGNIRSYAGWLALGAAAVMVAMIFGRMHGTH